MQQLLCTRPIVDTQTVKVSRLPGNNNEPSNSSGVQVRHHQMRLEIATKDIIVLATQILMMENSFLAHCRLAKADVVCYKGRSSPCREKDMGRRLNNLMTTTVSSEGINRSNITDSSCTERCNIKKARKL